MDLLADLLGHVSTRTTKIYRHLNPGYFREARKLAEGINPRLETRNRT